MGLFDGFDINPFQNRSSAGGLLWGVPGLALAGKNQANASIDSQMTPPGSPAGMIDPNDMGQPPAGGSAYSRMQHQLNGMGAQRASEQANASAMSNAAGARENLAARGGLSSGAAERLSQDAMGNQAAARQQVAGNLNQANMQGDIADEGMRRSAYNSIRMHNQDMQNQIYGGNQMANAQLEANRPKGLFGLGMFGL